MTNRNARRIIAGIVGTTVMATGAIAGTAAPVQAASACASFDRKGDNDFWLGEKLVKLDGKRVGKVTGWLETDTNHKAMVARTSLKGHTVALRYHVRGKTALKREGDKHVKRCQSNVGGSIWAQAVVINAYGIVVAQSGRLPIQG